VSEDTFDLDAFIGDVRAQAALGSSGDRIPARFVLLALLAAEQRGAREERARIVASLDSATLGGCGCGTCEAHRRGYEKAADLVRAPSPGEEG
jgi:hypothetical protein